MININNNPILLTEAALDVAVVETILSSVMTKGIDFSDMYFQQSFGESWLLEDGLVKKGTFSAHRGVGVRVINGEKTGFAYADEIELDSLRASVVSAAAIAKQSGESRAVKITSRTNYVSLYPAVNPLTTLIDATKIDLLKKVDLEARRDERVKQVVASLAGCYERILVINSEGMIAEDVRPLVRLMVNVVAEHNGRRETGSISGGRRGGYEVFLNANLALSYAREAVRIALVNLEAEATPAGVMPVVLGKGWPAVLLHEAVGHGLEGDFIRKKSSVFFEKLNQQVAADCCTIVDQGNFPGERRGSLNIDDEGTLTQCTVLIENGKLKNYMLDKLSARLLRMQPTGNARRESYAHIPLPRMTNTYMLAGQYMPEEIIASVDYGLYAPNFSGGQVDITSGEFVFSTSEAYLIEHGKITRPVKGATLIGNGPQVLHKISMVGNDLSLDSGAGTCGKYGQSVPVGVGQPTLKVTELTVGGTEKQ